MPRGALRAAWCFPNHLNTAATPTAQASCPRRPSTRPIGGYLLSGATLVYVARRAISMCERKHIAEGPLGRCASCTTASHTDHQDVDLLYLCGFHEHASLLACVKPAPHAAPRWHLFVRPTCPTKALWDGPHAGVEGARRCFLADGESHDIAHAGAVLRRELPRELSVLYHEQGRAAVDKALQPLLAACAGEAVLLRHPPPCARRACTRS